jgi:cation:H+ antiporter
LNGRIDRAEGALFVISALVFTAVTFHWAKDERRKAHAAETQAVAPEREKGAALLLLLVVVGLVGLVGGGRFFVTGAVGLARDLGVSERVIGLTVVAFGTSVPELAASLVAALRGHSDLAVGNVVGSNLFNILFILGVTSVILPIDGTLAQVRSDLIVMTVLTFFMAISLRKARTVTRLEGAVYVLGYVGFLAWLVASS